jgi:hypothetical protein
MDDGTRGVDVRYEREGVSYAEFTRPHLSSFISELIAAIADACRELDDDRRCRAIMLCSAEATSALVHASVVQAGPGAPMRRLLQEGALRSTARAIWRHRPRPRGVLGSPCHSVDEPTRPPGPSPRRPGTPSVGAACPDHQCISREAVRAATRPMVLHGR